jgi:hypothetical protein
MKVLLLSLTTGISMFGYSQTSNSTISVQSNGVIVHQAAGVESVSAPSVSTVQHRGVIDWNWAECIDALRLIDMKCTQLSAEECNRYADQRKAIELRMTELKKESGL